MQSSYDLIIAGGGIGGGALATVMARAGRSVLVLERDVQYRDRVRGEWLAPWGVLEAKRLGLYDALIAAGGHHLSRHISAGDSYDDPEEAFRQPIDMSALLPGVPGPLCLPHTVACQALIDAASAAGAEVLRGVSDVIVTPGASPSAAFTHAGERHALRARLIVGADGRNSIVRIQAGIEERRDPRHHLFSGMLVEGAHGWPDDLQVKGAEGEVNYLAFPQGGGRVRLYLGYGFDRKDFLAGPGARQRFLDAFRSRSVPGSEHLANATPVSHCYSYSNEDTWTDRPAVPGVILIGDAAGHNDPIIGQGLAITLRDVRLVSEALQARETWTPAAFAPYAEERAERLRRLRFAAHVLAVLDSEFGPEAEARRKRYRQRQLADPTHGMCMLAAFAGPENVPPEAFTPEAEAAMLA